MSDKPQEISERAFEFAVRVVKLCQVLDEKPGVSRTLANQLLRSGTSVGANLEESKGGQSRADFLSKVSIALKEARETHYWLRLLNAADILSELGNMEALGILMSLTKKPPSAFVSAVLAVTIVATLAGCSPPNETLVLTQIDGASVQLTSLELNPLGTAGDTTVFEAQVEKDGKPYGSFMGSIIKVGTTNAGWRKDREERMVTAVFDLPDGQISVLGVSYYYENNQLLPSDQPVTRAIVGGTGQYVGVDGEVTTVRNENGSYTHSLTIIR